LARSGFPLKELARTRRSFRRHCGRPRSGPAILLVADDRLPAADIDALHRRGDCYVSLSRSEGWGLGAFDAVAAARPVIMTGYGGQTDFLSPADAYLIDFQLVATSDPANAASYGPAQHWAEPDPAHAAQLMRQVYEHREEARAKGRRLCDHARRHYNERTVIQTMLSILERPGA
jgi:glycosyltransferase involved in cell wall biosynthesis